MLFLRLPSRASSGARSFTARVEYEATLVERRLDRREPGAPDAPAVAPLDPKTRRLELAGGHQFDFQSAPLRAWLNEHELRREPGENEVDFARRAFLAVRKGIEYFEGEKSRAPGVAGLRGRQVRLRRHHGRLRRGPPRQRHPGAGPLRSRW